MYSSCGRKETHSKSKEPYGSYPKKQPLDPALAKYHAKLYSKLMRREKRLAEKEEQPLGEGAEALTYVGSTLNNLDGLGSQTQLKESYSKLRQYNTEGATGAASAGSAGVRRTAGARGGRRVVERMSNLERRGASRKSNEPDR